MREAGASMLLMAPTGEYFARMIGLCERTRLRSLSTASDIEWLLQHTGCRDQFPLITADALRRRVLYLGPAANMFAEGAAKLVLVWSKLRSKDKEHLQPMERLRNGSYRPCDDVVAIVPPSVLPPLPQSDASTSNNGWVAAEPLLHLTRQACVLHVAA